MAFDNTPRDALARHVRQFQIHELRRVGAALADEMIVEPLPRHPFELAEQVELWLLSRIAPLRLQQTLREVKQQGRAAQIARVNQVEIDPLADDPLNPSARGSDKLGRQDQRVIGSEGRL